MRAPKWLRRAIFSLPYRMVDYDRRAFGPCEPEIKARINDYFVKFLDGYHAAIDADSLEDIARDLDRTVGSELIGFAYEGAGMYLALLDHLLPGRGDRVERFITGPAQKHDFITLIGIGLTYSRIPWIKMRVENAVERIEPGTCWFAVDGYGFHEGFFDHRRFIDRCVRPKHLTGYAARVFDQGLGRSIWFAKAADADRIIEAIDRFPLERQRDLWAGIGLACAFAGGVHPQLGPYTDVIVKLKSAAARIAPLDYALGVVFAAETRFKAGSASPWTTKACELVLDMPFEQAGRLARQTIVEVRAHLGSASAEEIRRDGYEMARQTIMKAVDSHRRALTARSAGSTA
jgi:enediyne biosynthesis protein E3